MKRRSGAEGCELNPSLVQRLYDAIARTYSYSRLQTFHYRRNTPGGDNCGSRRSQATNATVRLGERLERRLVCDVGEMDREGI
jgi:hypothetical protein